MKELINKIKRRIEIKETLRLNNGLLHSHQKDIDSIDDELDLISNGEIEADDAYIGTLLQEKLKIQQKICIAVERMVKLENELKGLF